MLKQTNRMDIAKGVIGDFGVLFHWTADVTEPDVLSFDTTDEMITCIAGRYDNFHITFEQALMKRAFTVWQSPWNDARGPEGEPWIA